MGTKAELSVRSQDDVAGGAASPMVSPNSGGIGLGPRARTPRPRSPTRLAEMFWILSPQQAFAVHHWVIGYSRRPTVAALLWIGLFRYVHPETGEVLLSQDELADATGVGRRDVPRSLAELVAIGGLLLRHVRVRGVPGRGVARYFVNPDCPTNIPPPDISALPHGRRRARRAVAARPLALDTTGEERVFLGDVVDAADQAVAEGGIRATARAVQRRVRVPRPIAQAVLEGAKQRARIRKQLTTGGGGGGRGAEPASKVVTSNAA